MGILMALVDYFPVVLFLVASIFYQRALYNKMSKGAFALFSAGTIFVFVAGFLKATHKLLFEANICNFYLLSECFFPMQTIGFVLAGCGILAMLIYPQGKNTAFSVAIIPIIYLLSNVVEFKGTMLFVALMVLGVLVLDCSLGYLAIKKKNYLILLFLVVAFICTLGMGYLSTKSEISDWYKEIVNFIGQACFLTSAILFKKRGLYNIDYLN